MVRQPQQRPGFPGRDKMWRVDDFGAIILCAHTITFRRDQQKVILHPLHYAFFLCSLFLSAPRQMSFLRTSSQPFFANPCTRRPSRPPCSMAQTDRQALVAFYNATDGAAWANNENWNTNAALFRWYGVKVNTNGRVVELRLEGNNLRGTYSLPTPLLRYSTPPPRNVPLSGHFIQAKKFATGHDVVSLVRPRVRHTVHS